MKILAISTSSNVCSVALLENANVIAELNSTESKTHSENLMPLVNKILEENKLNISEIDLIACDNGPRFIYRN